MQYLHTYFTYEYRGVVAKRNSCFQSEQKPMHTCALSYSDSRGAHQEWFTLASTQQPPGAIRGLNRQPSASNERWLWSSHTDKSRYNTERPLQNKTSEYVFFLFVCFYKFSPLEAIFYERGHGFTRKRCIFAFRFGDAAGYPHPSQPKPSAECWWATPHPLPKPQTPQRLPDENLQRSASLCPVSTFYTYISVSSIDPLLIIVLLLLKDKLLTLISKFLKNTALGGFLFLVLLALGFKGRWWTKPPSSPLDPPGHVGKFLMRFKCQMRQKESKRASEGLCDGCIYWECVRVKESVAN